jgi:hypothetical protein
MAAPLDRYAIWLAAIRGSAVSLFNIARFAWAQYGDGITRFMKV